MRERPILFSGPMVRALLAGTKTQTRRILREPEPWVGVSPALLARCPCGVSGDRLWVRERWASKCGEIAEGHEPCLRFDATDEDKLKAVESAVSRWRPSLHMPRWASRITLEVTEVRVQRLQDIGEEDAEAEGVEPAIDLMEGLRSNDSRPSYRWAFRALWDSINGDRAPWANNPWVWAVSFRRVQP